MVLDPESAAALSAQRPPSLLEQGRDKAGDLALSVEAPATDRADVALSVGETRRESWGEWGWRVTGLARFRRGGKPEAGVKGEITARW